jgi:Lrp/AsnC family leucine-responsive transcriptional regulator
MDPKERRVDLDDTDRRLLRHLRSDGRASTSEVGRALGLAQSSIHQRLRKLKERGLIARFAPELSPRALGLGVLAFVLVRTGGQQAARRVGDQLAAIDEVLEVHHVAGEDCLLIKVRVASNAALWELFEQRFERIEGIVSKRTRIVLESVKETFDLPLGDA